MTLSRKHYVKNWEHNEDEYAVSVELNGQPIPIVGKVAYIEEDAIYWRKSNAIHRWFVIEAGEGNDDCTPIYVAIEHLAELRDNCLEVLEDRGKAAEILPTMGGFFFGSTDYDECYFEDLKTTAADLTRLLKADEKLKQWNNKHSVEYWYSASW